VSYNLVVGAPAAAGRAHVGGPKELHGEKL
jgi:hypothetical protein